MAALVTSEHHAAHTAPDGPPGRLGTRLLGGWGRLLRRQRAALVVGNLLWLGPIAAGCALGDRLDFGVRARTVPAGGDLWWSIVGTNAGVALLAFAGVLTFGLATIAFSLVSGLLTGLGIAQATTVAGWGDLARHVLPHAWLELPAIGIAVGAGVVPLIAATRWLAGRGGARPSLRDVLGDAFGLLGTSLFLLLIAATIETWVST
ncbi:stage II sporulation protein M [Streptomyces sp. NPDC058000]|uniref:stage II sporulation protein M n=1 Tax=Streptomyces sp. NPDC058000 TaxID=3346299 RepID=UPI0036E7D022